MNVGKLSALCAALGGEHERELRSLLDFYDAHREALPIQVGDRVALTGEAAGIDYEKAYGWSANRGMLVPGNTGEVREIAWSSTRESWTYSVQFDVEWSSSTWAKGERRIYVASERKHTFMFSGRFLRAATVDDAAVLPPRGAAEYSVDRRYHLSFDEAMSSLAGAS